MITKQSDSVLKIARIKKGVTQETVADLIDITPAHMSNVETGKTKSQFTNLDCDCQCTFCISRYSFMR